MNIIKHIKRNKESVWKILLVNVHMYCNNYAQMHMGIILSIFLKSISPDAALTLCPFKRMLVYQDSEECSGTL